MVITGLSGSGKSSLAFDTLYAEGQRRYVESLSAYARQFLGRLDKPDVDLIEGLSPAISIEQKATSHNPRSTVGTVTEIHDYLRLLYARAGTPFAPTTACRWAQTVSQMVDAVLALPEDTKLMILARWRARRRASSPSCLRRCRRWATSAFGWTGRFTNTEPALKKTEARHRRGDRPLKVRRPAAAPGREHRAAPAVGGHDGNGRVLALEMDTGQEHLFSSKFACPVCSYSLAELEPRLFSFNSPMGACPRCDGLASARCSTRCAWWPSVAQPGQRRHQGLGPAQRLLFDAGSLAKHYAFDIEAPFESLPAPVQHAILHGSGEEEIAFSYILDRARRRAKPSPRSTLRGHHPQHGPPLPRDRFGGGARRPGALSQHPALPRMRRACAARPPCEGGRRRTGPRHL